MRIKSVIKQFIPEPALLLYHRFMAIAAAVRYGFPSRGMVVIGITGTKGKTSTANFIWSCLDAAGLKTGLLGTANIRIGRQESLNPYHMTMPGPFIIQGLLSRMRAAGCTHCIMEVTSEGIKQSRHWGIAYDIAVFTNLTPEHLPSHGGSFENYKRAKGKFFAALMNHPHKAVLGTRIPRTIIANFDSPHKEYFLNFPADQKLTYGLTGGADLMAQNIQDTSECVTFSVDANSYRLNVLGAFNVYNALPALAVARVLHIPVAAVQKGLAGLTLIPGRMEKIEEGQDFTVLVDYAHEKESMTAVLTTGRNMARSSGGRVIVLLGAEGGGRDKAKRPLMGRLSAERADFVIVSNVDPYEDDPVQILEDIATAAEQHGKVREKDLFVIEDRRQGIRTALELARTGDIVLITGKGAETSIVIGGTRSPWDDRLVVREELSRLRSRT